MMKNIMKRLLIIPLLILFWSKAEAQKGDLLYANAQYDLSNFRHAAKEYEKVFSVAPTYEIAKRIAMSWEYIYEFNNAKTWWKRVIEFKEAQKDDYLAYLLTHRRSDLNFDARNLLAGSNFSVEDFPQLLNYVPAGNLQFDSYKMKTIEGLNSKDSDYGIHLGDLGMRLFASNRGELIEDKKKAIRLDVVSKPTKRDRYHVDSRQYYSLYSQKEGEDPVQITVQGFELFHLTDPMTVSGSDIIFFTATPNRIKRKDEFIYPGIYSARFVASENKIIDVKPLSLNKTNVYGVMNPVIDTNLKRLYYCSNVEGGYGAYDLYYVTYDENWNLGQPVNLGSEVNSAGNERDPFFNETHLYFSSDGHKGLGSLDVFRIPFVSGNISGKIENLGNVINTVSDDFGFKMLSKKMAFLSSDRVNGLGYDDIYHVDIQDRNVKFQVLSNGHLNSDLIDNLSIEVEEGGKLVKKDLKDLAESLRENNKIDVVISSPGHFKTKSSLSLKDNEDVVSIKLTSIPYDLEVYNAIIYYDFDEDFLRELSKEKLDEISLLMLNRPELFLRIESHTDSRASDKYNQKLSERRAKSVTKYLDEKGIKNGRLSAEWFSKSKLVNNCTDGVPCPDLGGHQLNRRSELKLIAFPDRNINYELPAGSTEADFVSEEAAKKWFLRMNK